MKFRVTYTDKEIVSITRAEDGKADPNTEPIPEETTGETLYALIDAADEQEAREKAERLQIGLQTGLTKRELEEPDQESR